MPSVFAGNQTHNGSFRADQLQLSFGGQSARGLLVQNVSFDFTQAVSMLYEIGSAYVYFVGGRAAGNAGIGHIIGPSRLGQQLVETFRDLCFPHDIGFNASQGCGLAANGQPFRGGVSYTLQDAVLTKIGVTVGAENVVINKMLAFMYIDLEYQGGTGPTGLTSAGALSAGGVAVAASGAIIQGGVVAPPANAAASPLNTFADTFTQEPGLFNPDDAFQTAGLGDIPNSGDLGLGGTLGGANETAFVFDDATGLVTTTFSSP